MAGVRVANNVTYCNTRYLIQAQDDITINGVTFNQNEADMRRINFEARKAKMDRHFTEMEQEMSVFARENTDCQNVWPITVPIHAGSNGQHP